MERLAKTFFFFFLNLKVPISLIFETMKLSLAWNEDIGPEEGPT